MTSVSQWLAKVILGKVLRDMSKIMDRIYREIGNISLAQAYD